MPRAPGLRVRPAFESFIHRELLCHAGYRSGDPLAFWRSTSGFEVDFLLGDHTAIEVKATENLAPQETRGLAALAEEGRFARYLCVGQRAEGGAA